MDLPDVVRPIAEWARGGPGTLTMSETRRAIQGAGQDMLEFLRHEGIWVRIWYDSCRFALMVSHVGTVARLRQHFGAALPYSSCGVVNRIGVRMGRDGG